MTAQCAACERVFGSTTARALHDCPADHDVERVAVTDGGTR